MFIDISINRELSQSEYFSLGVLFVFGMALFIYQLYSLNKSEKTKNWPTVVGTIEHSDIAFDPGMGNDYTYGGYKQDVLYSYSIQEKLYKSTQVYLGATTYVNVKSIAQSRYKDKYRIGQSITVHYNPSNPNDAVLETGTVLENYIAMIIGFVLIAVSVIILIK